MGACASMPKAMRGVNGGAPPPEPPKEETTAAATVPPEDETANATGKEETVGGGEKKDDEGDNIIDGAKPAEDDKDKDGARRSLGSLLESVEVKELPRTEKIIPETQTIPEEQIKSEEVLPVSDKAAGEPAEKGVTHYVAPVARATEEDKETEKKY